MSGCEIVMHVLRRPCGQPVVEIRSGFQLCEDHKMCISKTNRTHKCIHSKAAAS